MVRSKYTFEKREREKAKRQKQIEKSAQRMMAKKAKTVPETETAGTDAVAADPEAGTEYLAENTKDSPDHT